MVEVSSRRDTIKIMGRTMQDTALWPNLEFHFSHFLRNSESACLLAESLHSKQGVHEIKASSYNSPSRLSEVRWPTTVWASSSDETRPAVLLVTWRRDVCSTVPPYGFALCSTVRGVPTLSFLPAKLLDEHTRTRSYRLSNALAMQQIKRWPGAHTCAADRDSTAPYISYC